MPLTESDLNTLRLLIREEVDGAFERRFEPFRDEVNDRFDYLFKQDEKREQEHLAVCEQLDRLVKQGQKRDEQLDRIESKLDRHEERLSALERKTA